MNWLDKFLQNSRNSSFDTYWNIYIYLFVALYHVCLFIDICERKTNLRSEDLTLGQIFFKMVLLGWSEGTALLNNRFGPNRMIAIFQEKLYQTTYLKGVPPYYNIVPI